MEIPGVGTLTLDNAGDWYCSRPFPASALGGAVGRIVVTDESLTEVDPPPVYDAVTAFLHEGEGRALRAASAEVFRYYRDSVHVAQEAGLDLRMPDIPDPGAVWDYVTLGSQFQVDRDRTGEVFISVECECAWEPEHGLQLVFRRGRAISKLGPFDGHLTNQSAFGRDDIGEVVYVSAFEG
jgi:hypothetical protein